MNYVVLIAHPLRLVAFSKFHWHLEHQSLSLWLICCHPTVVLSNYYRYLELLLHPV